MKRADQLLGSALLTKHRKTPKEPCAESSTTTQACLIRLWERMAQIYGHRWHSQYGDVDGAAFGTWATGLAGLSPEQFGVGVAKCMHLAWPPTLPEFRGLCECSDEAWAECLRALESGWHHEWQDARAFTAASNIRWELDHARSWEIARRLFVDAYRQVEEVRQPPASDAPRLRHRKDHIRTQAGKDAVADLRALYG